MIDFMTSLTLLVLFTLFPLFMITSQQLGEKLFPGHERQLHERAGDDQDDVGRGVCRHVLEQHGLRDGLFHDEIADAVGQDEGLLIRQHGRIDRDPFLLIRIKHSEKGNPQVFIDHGEAR